MKKTPASLIFLLWAGTIITIFYVVQKPDLFFLSGLGNTVWTLFVTFLLLFNAYGIGIRVLKSINLQHLNAINDLILSLGIGLGGLGLLGLAFSAAQLASTAVLTTFQIVLGAFFLFAKDLTKLRKDLKESKTRW
ncbi:MAG: hypothetical protein R3307_01980, partial [Anaerolineales bacterium]|nr:hypothetical protein [Anaerolineales bacterium]